IKMAYKEILVKPFLNDVKDIKKDKVLLDRLHKKMDEILENPEHYPVKKYELKGKRGAHVGSFVIVFEIKGDEVIFWRFKHHDYAYE
ncbi:MAG: type II toxin-antitoxin system RelE/ParE family toxin, partial [Nanoarchaeota archaeon]